jgi:hypothetical protein
MFEVTSVNCDRRQECCLFHFSVCRDSDCVILVISRESNPFCVCILPVSIPCSIDVSGEGNREIVAQSFEFVIYRPGQFQQYRIPNDMLLSRFLGRLESPKSLL